MQALLQDYQLDPKLLSLVGGGGGCTTVVPWLSRHTGIRYVIADKAGGHLCYRSGDGYAA